MTLVFFESPHRLAASLGDMADIFGDRPAALAGNLTKAHERYRRDTLRPLAECVGQMDVVRGQYTVVVGGAEPIDTDQATGEAVQLIEVLLRHGADPRLVRSAVRDLTDLGRNQIYDLVERHLANTHLADPYLADPHLADPYLAKRSLAEGPDESD